MVTGQRYQSSQSQTSRGPGPSNSHPSAIYDTPKVGSDWWWWNSAWALWEWVTVKSVNEVGEGLVVFSCVASPDRIGRLRTLRAGRGYQPVRPSDRTATWLRDLFPESRQESLLA